MALSGGTNDAVTALWSIGDQHGRVPDPTPKVGSWEGEERFFLPGTEPAAGPWRVEPVHLLVELLGRAMTAAGRPLIIAVDGRGAGGKSTLAGLLHAAVPASAVVHTDDIAWRESWFGWAPLLARNVLEPARRGQPVQYRPQAWDTHARDGAIAVPTGLDLVIVEGVGAGQRELSDLLDAVVWVQSDFAEAERRGIARDTAEGVNGDPAETIAFWHAWMAEELPFQELERPWERACVIVSGTPRSAAAPGYVVLADGPLTTIAI